MSLRHLYHLQGNIDNPPSPIFEYVIAYRKNKRYVYFFVEKAI